MTTTAEQIANALNNDGQTWETDGGVHLDELLERAAYYWKRNDLTVHVFADGSMIGQCESYWDIIRPGVDHEEREVWIDGAEDTHRPWAYLDSDGEPEGWDYRAV